MITFESSHKILVVLLYFHDILKFVKFVKKQIQYCIVLELCTYVYMFVCMYVCTYVCMYVRTYVCMYVSMYVCMCIICKYITTHPKGV